jgi:hypothetical protein
MNMRPQIRVEEFELNDVLAWAKEHGEAGITEHPDGTYEEGVHDAIEWVLGRISARPDEQ